MEKHILSKSTFLRGLQCLKSLHLNKFHHELCDPIDETQAAKFTTGKMVGELARDLFPGGINARSTDPSDIQDSLQHTQKLIAEGAPVIYEAAFQHDRVIAFVDILVQTGNTWRGYEVKSSTSAKDEYLWDLALQYHVITESGFEIDDFSVVHLNNKYVRKGDLDLHALFTQVSLISGVKRVQTQVKDEIEKFVAVLASDQTPEIDIGPYCRSPYECDFLGHCWRHIPEDSLFTLARINQKLKFELYYDGLIRIEDLPVDFPHNRSSRAQVDGLLYNRSIIDGDRIRQFLDAIEYPRYFLDFETFNPGIPPFDNTSPYQQIPYQYSLHTKLSPTGEVSHSGFLAEAGTDPRIPLAEALLSETEGPGDILVYNRSFEAGVIKGLVKHMPDRAADLEERMSRFVDLMVPFQKRYCYLPQMKGSYSLKAVLPALVPELRHDDLEVADGMQAMGAYLQLAHENDVERLNAVRDALWEYCKLDTFAMVRILEKLESLQGE